MAARLTALTAPVLWTVATWVMTGMPAAAQDVPMPQPRPATGAQRATPPATVDIPTEPSDCVKRLSEIATFTPMPPIAGENGCGAIDVVRLQAVTMLDRSRVTLEPPAMLRCSMAQAVSGWLRDDVAGAMKALGSSLKAIANFDSYDCRGRNRAVGGKLSEHGRANALDVRAFRLANGTLISPTDATVSREVRAIVRAGACARFATVLGPGSDGYHEDHVHLDLAERSRGYRICQWDIRDPQSVAAMEGVSAEQGPASQGIPLPQPKPAALVSGATEGR
jgi:hypothetical protein